MVSKFYDFYGQGESREVLLARIKDWLYSDVDNSRQYTCHIKLNCIDKDLRELFEDCKNYEENDKS